MLLHDRNRMATSCRLASLLSALSGLGGGVAAEEGVKTLKTQIHEVTSV